MFHDLYQGCSLLAWTYQVSRNGGHVVNDLFLYLQHTLGHHPYTNIDGADPDIVTASSVRDINSIVYIFSFFIGCS